MLNGTPPEAPTVQVKAHLIPKPGGGILRLATTAGDYVGSIEFDTASPQALQAMANWFQAWVAQQAGGIQIASGSGIAGLRS